MFTRPENLTDDEVVGALAAGWGLHARTIEYVAAGFGSYHWSVEAGGARWFATADPIDKLEFLQPALAAAHALRDDGLAFVVAPQRTSDGGVLHRVKGYVLALYPYIEGTRHAFGNYETRAERVAVLDCLLALHAVSPPAALRTDDFAITERDGFASACQALDTSWNAGPYGEPARALVAEHREIVDAAFARYDAMVPHAQESVRVGTHGEPHRANTIDTVDGLVLIDWDTALFAPPERDLWALVDEDSQVLELYAKRGGTRLDPALLDLYRMRWSLTEIALYASHFHGPHADNADTRVAWLGLQRYVRGLAR